MCLEVEPTAPRDRARHLRMHEELDRRVEPLVDLCRHLYEALEALTKDEGEGGIKGTNAERTMRPHLMQARQILHELNR